MNTFGEHIAMETNEKLKFDDDETSSMTPLRKYRSQESIDELFSFDSLLNSSGILQPTRQGLLKDIVQTQLALWTFTFSLVYTYCWQKRVQRTKSFVVALVSINLAVCLSGLLALLVLGAHIFNRDLYSMWTRNDADVSEPPKRGRAISISSVCSAATGHSRRSSGTNTPTMAFKGHAAFWQRKISTERVYFGSTVRS